MENHLIIGLGGTGGKIIRSLRKTIYQEFRNQSPEQVNIQYLYMDSDTSMMGLDDPSWKILGRSVQLDKNQQLIIKGSADLESHLDNINSFPGIKSWIGDKEQWKEILNGVLGDVLGGQKRRLGRFLLACKITEFNDQVQNLVRELREKGTTAVTFHICCGLAGGTGSGTVIDVVAQIRSMYPEVRNYRIIVYALLPDSQPKKDWNTGNYHANGYAALVELNALSVGALHPYDITGIQKKLVLSDPFNGCYLFFNENENGLTVDIDKDIPNILADFIYQKLIAVHSISWGSLGRMENAENGDGTPECAPGTQRAERSKRFLTFGIKRLAIPEEEIREFITYNFARQASLQMLYDNWVDALGYSDESKPEDYRSEVNQKDNWEKWMITNNHLTLSLGILDSEIKNKKWKPITQDWQNTITSSKEFIRTEEPTTWLDKLEHFCQQRFDIGFREHGVRRFYEIKTTNRAEQAKEIRRIIEQELFLGWRNGNRSLYSIVGIVDALLDVLEERYKSVDDQIVIHREAINTQNDKIIENKKTQIKMGLLSAVFGKRNKLLDAQALCLQVKYINSTQVYSWQFAKELLQQLRTEIGNFRTEITRFRSSIIDVQKQFETQCNERCSDEGLTDLRKAVIWFYKPAVVKEFTNKLIHDDKTQFTQTSRVRQVLIASLGERPSFSSFNKQMLKQKLLDIITTCCETEATNAHNNLISSDKESDSQFGISIIEKLAKEYSGNDEGLKQYIHQLSGHAGNYLDFNELEINRKGPGITDAPTKVGAFTVILPKAPEWADFMTNLRQTLKGSRRTGTVELLECESNPREISFVSITNLFPLRYVKQIEFLKQHYDSLIKNANTNRTEIELHSEGNGNDFPPLYFASVDSMKAEALPYILLAIGLNIIKSFHNPQTGIDELVIQVKDKDGFDQDSIRLGNHLTEAADQIDYKEIEILMQEVDHHLSNSFQHISKQEELKKRIVSTVNDVKKDRKDNINDAVYKRFNEAGREAVRLISEKVNKSHEQ